MGKFHSLHIKNSIFYQKAGGFFLKILFPIHLIHIKDRLIRGRKFVISTIG